MADKSHVDKSLKSRATKIRIFLIIRGIKTLNLIKINSLAVTNKFVRQGCKKIAESVFTLKY